MKTRKISHRKISGNFAAKSKKIVEKIDTIVKEENQWVCTLHYEKNVMLTYDVPTSYNGFFDVCVHKEAIQIMFIIKSRMKLFDHKNIWSKAHDAFSDTSGLAKKKQLPQQRQLFTF